MLALVVVLGGVAVCCLAYAAKLRSQLRDATHGAHGELHDAIQDADGVSMGQQSQSTTQVSGNRTTGGASNAITSDSFMRLAAALNELESAVIVATESNPRWYANRKGREILSAHDARSLIATKVDTVAEAALFGATAEEAVEIFGPPSSAYVVRGTPIAKSDHPAAVVVVRNVTEEKRIDRVRKDFVANISHELKTPLGAAGLLAETIAGESDVAVIASLSDRMVTETNRMAETIDDLLELSMIEFDEPSTDETFDIVSALSDSVARLSVAAEAASVAVDWEPPDAIELSGSRVQVVSAMSNLLDNAIKYSPVGSTTLVTCVRNDDAVVVEVADEGVGIPQRDVDRIFERFFRVDRARSRGTGGTGLGLAIVRHVAHNHGGSVSVVTREGTGSTFTLTLPLPIDAEGSHHG